MFDLQKYLAETSCTLVRPLGKKDGLWLICRADGEKRVLRRYDGENAPVQALCGAKIPQLPQIYEWRGEDGCTVSQEEFIEGTLLAELLRRTLLTESQTAAVTREVCLALEALHTRGFVHRDVKPENVMLTPQGRVVLLDLDAAAPVLGAPDTNTRLLGTAGYAAPEQFGFARCDVRADIFALGVMINVMRTGAHPSVRLADGRLGRVVRRCTHTNAAQRYESVGALMKQLPRAKPAQTCALCGYTTPGGGCAYCGGTAKPQARRGIWIAAAVAACIVSAAAGYAAGLQNPTSAMARPAQAQAEEPAAVTILVGEAVPVAAWERDDIPFTTPFAYDLDGDGTDEQYCFAVADYWSGEQDIQLAQRGSRRYKPNDSFTEVYLPVICRENADGTYSSVPELAKLLQNAEISLFYLGERPQALISATRMPGARLGVWEGGVEAQSTLACAGEWIVYARAELAGQPVEAAIQKQIREEKDG